ncbi:Ig-like domain-containing protein [Bifidobacterium longum]|nr:Ig-like domain-containing protein [Bifidobacterium longum]MDB6818114.1 Ig-like domain-containing protein [Bifidobacterium longum]
MAGDRCDAGVGGEVGRAFEAGDVADDVPAYQDFMKQIVDQGIYIQWYDSATYPGGGVGYQDMFNGSNSPYVQDTDKGKISDSIFLNYWFSGNMLKDSAAHAESFGIDPKYAVFAGIESGQKKFDSIGSNAGYMNVNLDDTGKPYVSLAALGADFVSRELGDDKKVYPKYQNQVFDRERRLWTGSSTGEKGTTDIADNYIDDGTSNDGWKGFASQIAECSVVGGSMFSTSFNTGHGLEWRDGGERTSDQQWGNINLQDILPTWQWWIDADSDPLQADFDYGKDYEAVPRFKYTKVGGYEGGDSLVLSGKLSNDNTIRLYKTDLDVAAGSKIDLTYNKLNSDDSKLQLGLILADDPETVVPVDVTDGSAGNGWKTASVDLSQYAGKKIATLKLYAVGADGSRSLAAEAPLNEAAAVSGVKVEPGKDGNVKVSWTNPQVSGEKTVTVKSDNGSWRYAAQPYSQTVKVSADKSEATIPNAPVDGSRYVVTVDNAGGTTATATGVFADATIEPYPACSVTWNGDRVTLVRPETQDWRYLYMTEKWTDENGEKQEKQLGANYTYSQSTPPITGIIRGRTTPSSYTKSIPSGHELWVQVEDYNGNKTEPVKIPTADELAKCTVADPTQPDAKKSTLTAVDGSAVADGKAIRTVQATVKDSFGNPLANAEVAFELPEGVSAIGGNTTVKTDAAGVASLNVVSTKVGKYTVKAVLNGNAIGKGVTVEFTKVAVTPNKPGDQNKPGDTKPNKPSQNDNKNNDKNGASLSATGSSVIAIVAAMVVLLGAGAVVLRARSKTE